MIEILLIVALLSLGATAVTGALGPYLVGSAVARVLVAVAAPPALVYPTLAITALVDGALLCSFLDAAGKEPPQPETSAVELARALARPSRGSRTDRTSLPCG